MVCSGQCKHCDIKGCHFRTDDPIEIDEILETIIDKVEDEE